MNPKFRQLQCGLCVLSLTTLTGLLSAATVLTGVQGQVKHKGVITIQGSSFGTKAQAAPTVWDDCSGTDPLVKWDWAYPHLNDAAFKLTYRTPAQVTKANGAVGGVALPHRNTTKYLAGAHYNSGSLDAHRGYNVCAGKNNQQGQVYTYISFYQMIDPSWSHNSGSDYNWKEYDWAAGSGYMGDGPNLYFDNKFIVNQNVQWGVNYVEGLNSRIVTVNTALVDYYPSTGMVFPKISVPGPKEGWRKVELVLKHNSSDGFHRIYQNNKLVWEVYLDDDNLATPTARAETVIGGYVREAGNTERYKNNWRYYADVYYDHSLARVILADKATYSQATILEPQIPSAWSGTQITATVNLGKLPDTGTAYLFVFAADGSANSTGFPVTLGGSVEPPPPDSVPPSAPAQLIIE
jgi:hypothetical protein